MKKTRSAFGDAKAEMCKRKNISSCWTDCASDEDLKKLNDIVGMLFTKCLHLGGLEATR